MPAVCVDDCGFAVVDGVLGIDWDLLGMKRVCVTGEAYGNAFNPGTNAWVLLRDQHLSWTNTTCRTHRVLARLDIPWVRIRLGRDNTWFVRGYIDGALNAPPPSDVTRDPELEWSTNWYPQMPETTDQQQQTPGSAEVEWIVPPGDTLNIAGRIFAMAQFHTVQPNNFLGVSAFRVQLSAWPSNVDTGSGRTC